MLIFLSGFSGCWVFSNFVFFHLINVAKIYLRPMLPPGDRNWHLISPHWMFIFVSKNLKKLIGFKNWVENSLNLFKQFLNRPTVYGGYLAGATTLSITTLSIMTLRIQTLSILTFNIAINQMRHSAKWLSAIAACRLCWVSHLIYYVECQYAECRYTECHGATKFKHCRIKWKGN